MSRKRIQASRRKKSLTPVAPYALVLYEEGLTVGVVSCKSIEEDVVKGAQCMAPNPVDWPDNSEKDRFPAIIVELGHDIDYLYTINVSPKGKILKDPPSAEVLAKKRELKEHEARSKLRKEVNQADLDNRINQLPPLFAETHHDLNQPGTSSSGSDRLQSHSKEASNLNHPETFLPLDTGASNATSTKATLEKDQLKPTWTHGIVNDTTTTNAAFQKASKSSNCCSFNQILSEASPSQNALLLEVFEHAASNSAMSPSDNAFLMRVFEAIKSNMKDINEIRGTSTCNNTLDAKDISINEAPSTSITDLECLKQGPIKFRFLQDFDIYLERNVMFGIPPIITKSQIQTPESSSPSTSSSKKRKKPKGKENGLYPRQLVTYLLKALVPQDSMIGIKVNDIPQEIIKAIRAYVNYRLPEEERITEKMIYTYVSDYIRSLSRDRAKENNRKKLKNNNAQESEYMFDFDLNEIPIIILDGNNANEINQNNTSE